MTYVRDIGVRVSGARFTVDKFKGVRVTCIRLTSIRMTGVSGVVSEESRHGEKCQGDCCFISPGYPLESHHCCDTW